MNQSKANTNRLLLIFLLLGIIVVGGLIVSFDFLPKQEIVLDRNEAGLIIKNNGQIESEILLAGKHRVYMKDTVITYKLNKLEVIEEFQTQYLGSRIENIRASMTYSIVADSIPKLYENFGVQYRERMLIPELRTAVRKNTLLYNRDSVDLTVLIRETKKLLEGITYFSGFFNINELKLDFLEDH